MYSSKQIWLRIKNLYERFKSKRNIVPFSYYALNLMIKGPLKYCTMNNINEYIFVMKGTMVMMMVR